MSAPFEPAPVATESAPVPTGTTTGTEDPPAEVAALASSVAALDQLGDLPVVEHVTRYDALHGELSDALAAIDGI